MLHLVFIIAYGIKYKYPQTLLFNLPNGVNMDKIMFAEVNFPLLDKVSATSEILAIPKKFSFWDDYRNTLMIPLMSKSEISASNNISGEFKWAAYAPKIIVDWFDEFVFPWMGMKSRVMALITQPNFSNYEHIDCDPHELNSRQHKFRIVLQGKTNTLYFITDKGNISAPEIQGPFIMDGGWPHGMINDTNEIKVTLALGAPWTGNDKYDNINLLMDRSIYRMPDDLSSYWKK
jgi:hypothetical protein